MPSLNMEGPYPLTTEDIDANVLKEVIGNYALGKIAQGQFVVMYVGRSDSDLCGRIKDYIGGPYAHFMFSYSTNAVFAYQKECENYHDFFDLGLDNDIHPHKPAGHSNWKCPRCNN